MRREAGFSLIEMLVALAIMALAAGLVVMTAPGPSGRLADETDALIRSLATARDLALVENRAVTVEITETGYETRIARRLGAPETRASVNWRADTTVAIGDGRLPTAVTFDSIGLTEPVRITLFRDGAKDGVILDGSGRIGRLFDDRQT
jgi:general secretion pathway protein H